MRAELVAALGPAQQGDAAACSTVLRLGLVLRAYLNLCAPHAKELHMQEMLIDVRRRQGTAASQAYSRCADVM
jgi:hypothetical protein